MADTLTDMKSRIASELRRDDLTSDIADAITSAINVYKYERFSFNRAALVDVPAADGTTGNQWMMAAYGERLIRHRAKLDLYVNVIKLPADSPLISQMQAEIEDALKQLRISQTQVVSATAGTLGYMKQRIANEINRSEFPNEIADAISDAILYYNNERYFFNETRSNTFSTVASQSDYTSSDSAEIGNILKIDYVTCLAGGLLYTVDVMAPEVIEESIINGGIVTGIPAFYTFYNQTLRFYPVPNDVYTIRAGYVRQIAAPATDVETLNPWMTTAERLIRTRAKAELYAHVEGLADPKLAEKYLAMADDYFSDLEMQTTRKTQMGPALIRAYDL